MTAATESMLSAASLITTLVALLYSLWYQDLERAAETSGGLNADETRIQIGRLKTTAGSKALPLSLASLVTPIVFMPVAIGFAVEAADLLLGAVGSGREYDAMKSAFVAVYVLSLFLTTVALRLTWRIWNRVRLLQRSV